MATSHFYPFHFWVRLLLSNNIASDIQAMVARDCLQRSPYSYHLQLGTQEIRRLKNRIEELRQKLDQTLTEGHKEIKYEGFCDLKKILDRLSNFTLQN